MEERPTSRSHLSHNGKNSSVSLGRTDYSNEADHKIQKLSPFVRTIQSPKQLHIKCFTSPLGTHLAWNEALHVTSPHPNSDLITPFLKLFHWSLLTPDVIEYDRIRGEFYCKRGKRLWKVVTYLWLLLMAVYMCLICLNDANKQYTVKAVVGKFTWICYTLFDLSVIKTLRMNGDKIAKLLTEGNRISQLFDRVASQNKDSKKQKKKTIVYTKYIIIAVCVISVVYTIAFVWYVIVELTAVTTNLYTIFMELTGDEAEAAKSHCQNRRCHLLQRYTSNVLAAITITVWLLVACGVELIWVIFLLMMASFGIYFNRIFSSCIHIIETNCIDIVEGVRIFAKGTLLLEDVNSVFGSELLWIVIASILYVAHTFGEMLAGFYNGLIYDVLNCLGLLPFIVTLYTCSELHRTGQTLPSVIKRKFFDTDVTVTITEHQMLQMIQGTNVAQYDALSNNIGLKGHGFFTISYVFVTSFVGAIITYTLVAVQLKLGEIQLGVGLIQDVFNLTETQ